MHVPPDFQKEKKNDVQNFAAELDLLLWFDQYSLSTFFLEEQAKHHSEIVWEDTQKERNRACSSQPKFSTEGSTFTIYIFFCSNESFVFVSTVISYAKYSARVCFDAFGVFHQLEGGTNVSIN